MGNPIVELDDDETIFRGLPRGTGHYERRGSTIFVKSSAFNDREMKPSVDLCSLSPDCEPRPELHPHDGVLLLAISDVREIEEPILDQKGRLRYAQQADVRHRPLPENPAHCQIEPEPDYASKKHFRKVKTALAVRATWFIEPPPVP